MGVPAKRWRNVASSSRKQIGERRADRLGPDRELLVARGGGELVPGADGEAIVAAIDAVADGGAELAGYRALVLDGQVGDAAARVELVGRRKRVGRTDVETAPAVAAVVGVGTIGRDQAVVRMTPRYSHEPWLRETRLVCLPCQPSPASAASGFSISGAVSTNTLTSPPDAACSAARGALQARLDDVVVVAPLGVDRDAGARRLVEEPQRVVVGRVAEAEDDR